MPTEFKATAWVWTLFEPTVNIKKSQYTYIVYGKEICPTTGRHHWQGYVEFKCRKTKECVQNTFGVKGMHVEPRRALDPKKAADYSKKDGEFFEDGVISQQGARTDLDTMCNDLQSRKRSLYDLMEGQDAPTVVKYRSGLAAIASHSDCLESKKIRVIKEVHLVDSDKMRLYRRANEEYPNACMINGWYNGEVWHQGMVLWDCYNNEDTIITINWTELLARQLLEPWRVTLPVKYGVKYANWTTVVFLKLADCDKGLEVGLQVQP